MSSRCPVCNQTLPGLMRRPRTTGPRSQNHRFRGHCSNIAMQLPPDEHGYRYTESDVAIGMKRMAVSEGYRTYLALDGTEQPVSEASLTVEEEALLQNVLQRFADLHGLWLMEYDEATKTKYRSVGGRTMAEMEQYWKERTHET